MIFLAAILMTLSTSCKRDHLYYASSDTATVLVKTDWSRSGVHPSGVTVFAYRESDGSLYKRFPPVSAEEKNQVSHRARALKVLYEKLKEAGYAEQ